MWKASCACPLAITHSRHGLSGNADKPPTVSRLQEGKDGEGEGDALLVPVAPAPPVLHICGVANGIRIIDMQIGNAPTSAEPGVLVTSICTSADDNDDVPAGDLSGSDDDRNITSATDSVSDTKDIATAPPTYKLPPKIDPTNIGTGLSVSFHRVHTLGGGPYSTRITPIHSLEPPFQRISTAHQCCLCTYLLT